MRPGYCLAVLLAVASFQPSMSAIVDYKVTVKTGRGLLAGTDSVYHLTIWTRNQSSVVFEINGKLDILERGSEDEFTFTEKELTGIDYVTIQRRSPRELFQGWFLCWIKIEANGAVYQVVVNRWIKDESVHRYAALLESCPHNLQRVQYCRAKVS